MNDETRIDVELLQKSLERQASTALTQAQSSDDPTTVARAAGAAHAYRAAASEIGATIGACSSESGESAHAQIAGRGQAASYDLGTFAIRDRVLAPIANFLLRLTSPRYQAMIGGSIRYGLKSAARDSKVSDSSG